jgi:butyryl-CoA dehydrogenase
VDFKFTEEHNMLRDMVRKFVDQDVKPIAAKIDKEKAIPEELLKKAAELGLMGIPFPEEYGGSDLGETGACIMLEELGHGCASTAVTISAHQSLASSSIYFDGTDEQKEKYLVPLAKGEKLGAFALTEPQAGSDASNLLTFAEKDGNHYILNGTKNWVTNGINSNVVIVFAMTEKGAGHHGISTFIVEKGWEGFSTGKKEDKLGIRASDTCELYFDDCRVPVKNRIGEEGQGFKIAMKTLDGGRIGIASQALGIAQAALERSVEYSKERKQFGEYIERFGAIQDKLADMATEISAARLLTHRAAYLKDNGKQFNSEAAMAKSFASTVAMRASTECVQIFGGYGYMQEYGVERLMRDAKITQIYEGTSEIQQLVIARSLLGDPN